VQNEPTPEGTILDQPGTPQPYFALKGIESGGLRYVMELSSTSPALYITERGKSDCR